MRTPTRHLLNGLIAVLGSSLFGIIGYRLAGWEWLESAYMVVITIFSVGYGEVHEIGPGMRIFTMIFIVLGCTAIIYLFGAFVNWLTEGQLQALLGQRKMKHDIDDLCDHTIICGYGRIGRILAADLNSHGLPFVIIDRSQECQGFIEKEGYLHVDGDATSDDTLIEAGIHRAKTLASVLPADAANVYITLSARALSPNLNIISRGSQPNSEAKLLQAGATRVVLPAHIGAERIANYITKPHARDLLDSEIRDGHFLESLSEIGLYVEEMAIGTELGVDGTTLQKLESQSKSAFIVVAVKRPNGDTITKPPLDTYLSAGDILIVISHQGFIPEFGEPPPDRGAND